MGCDTVGAGLPVLRNNSFVTTLFQMSATLSL